ncbi:MAG: hypothetical protein R3A11_08545 [Bdellovibrionota bacterium]
MNDTTPLFASIKSSLMWSFVLSALSSGVVMVLGSRDLFVSYLVGLLLMTVNFYAIYVLGKNLISRDEAARQEDSEEDKQTKIFGLFSLLFLVKMGLLFAGVYVCVAVLGLDSLGLGLGIFSLIIFLCVVAAARYLR